MNLPFDIKELLSESRSAEERRNQEIKVAIFVDSTSPEYLQEVMRNAFIPELATGLIHVSSFYDEIPVVNSNTDIAIIIAGHSQVISGLHNRLHRAKVSGVTVAVDAETVLRAQAGSSTPMSRANIISSEDTHTLLHDLAKWILDETKKDLAFAANFPFIRKSLGYKIVDDTSTQNALIGGVVIIPGADMPLMTANQIKMLLQIAAAYGFPLNAERIKELAGVVGGGFALRSVARQAVGIVPALGWAVKAGIGYTGTQAMGRAAIEYFESGGNLGGLGDAIKQAGQKVAEGASVARDAIGSAASNVGSSVKNKDSGFRFPSLKKKQKKTSSVAAEDVVAEDIVVQPLALPQSDDE